MNEKVTQVNDRPAELWIKVLSLVAMITLPLVGVIGSFLIDGQKETNSSLEKINNAITSFSVKLENHDGRISRVEDDVKEVRDVQDNYGQRIFKLEEKRNGR